MDELKRSLLHILLLVSLVTGASHAMAESSRMLILTSSSAEIYSSVKAALESAIRSRCKTINIPACKELAIDSVAVSDMDPASPIDPGNYDLIVTMGQSAATYYHAIGAETPAIFSLIQKNTYQQLKSPNSTATFLDQPPERVIRFTRIILDKEMSIGLVISPETRQNASDYSELMAGMEINHLISEVEDVNRVGPVLTEILTNIDVLVTLPDPALYNRKNIFNILLTTYNNHVPVIGYSASYVKAGALAAVYTSPEDAGRDTANSAISFLSTGRLPQPSYADSYSIAYNQSVAYSMNITLPDEERVIRLLDEESD